MGYAFQSRAVDGSFTFLLRDQDPRSGPIMSSLEWLQGECLEELLPMQKTGPVLAL